MNLLKNFWIEEDGQDLIEYALLVGFIIVTTTAALTAIGSDVSTVYTNVELKTADAATKSAS